MSKEDRLAKKEERKANRVPFKDRKIVKWTKENAPNLLGGVLEVAGDVLGIDALSNLGEKIAGSNELTAEQKQYAIALLEIDLQNVKSEDEAITRRWESDNQTDSWLSKNIRPLVLGSLLLFMFIIVIADSIGVSNFEVKESYINMIETLLMIVIVAYFGSRGIKHLDERRLKNGKEPLKFNEIKFNKE